MVRAAAVLLMLLVVPSAAQVEKRIALLIENQSYASEIGRLAHPHENIAILERPQRDLGFATIQAALLDLSCGHPLALAAALTETNI